MRLAGTLLVIYILFCSHMLMEHGASRSALDSIGKRTLLTLKKEPVTAIYLFTGLFLLLSQLLPWPLVFLGRTFDFWVVAMGVAEGAAYEAPALLILTFLAAITNIVWMRSMVHSIMDSFILFVMSFIFCIPALFTGFFLGRAYGLGPSDFAPIMMGAWLGTYFLMTSVWRLFVYERFNAILETVSFRNRFPGLAFIDFIKVLLEKHS